MGKSREDYFGWEPGTIKISQCALCSHKHEDTPTCDAYPDGIPDEILSNQVDHTKPYKGDNGIQFEPIERG